MKGTSLRIVVASTLFGLWSIAGAQLEITATRFTAFSLGFGHSITYNGLNPSISTDSNHWKLGMEGLVTRTMSRNGAGGSVWDTIYYSLLTGHHPVQISNFFLNANVRLINGGGNGTQNPETSLYASMSLQEYADTNGNHIYEDWELTYGPVRAAETYITSITGNGYIDATATAGADSYVLAADTNYMLSVTQNTRFFANPVDDFTPTIKITTEPFELAGDFRVQTLPEPSTYLAFGLPVLGVALKRRRSKPH